MKEHERKIEQVEKFSDFCRESMDVDADTYGKVLEYKSDLSALERIYKNFTDEDGNFNIWTTGTDRDKQTLNSYSMKIAAFERWLLAAPIYDRLKQEHPIELPEFLKDVERDSKGRFIDTVMGWYQNSHGDLFHYDGTVWDSVPTEKINDLEFLGG